MKIAVIGADGQLGSDLMKTLTKDRLFPLYYPQFDITQFEGTRRVLTELGADIIINTAAFHRVDECEEDPHQSFLVNAIAVRNLAALCRELGCVLVHFSTDYVFDGHKRKPYVEEDCPHPLNVYAVSKLAGEIFVRNLCEKYFLIRTCGLYGETVSREKGTNFVDAMISLEKTGKSLRVVDDQWVTPTSTAELAQKISQLIRTHHYGLFHLTNEGECTWFEFAREIFDLTGKAPRMEPMDSSAYGARAQRPFYSVLENKKAREIGLPELSHWKDTLRNHLAKKGLVKNLATRT